MKMINKLNKFFKKKNRHDMEEQLVERKRKIDEWIESGWGVLDRQGTSFDLEHFKELENELHYEFPDSLSNFFFQFTYHFDDWSFMNAEEVYHQIKEMESFDSGANFIPIAKKSDDNQLSCFQRGLGEKVFIIKVLSNQSLRCEKAYESLNDWVVNINHKFLAEKDVNFEIRGKTLQTSYFTVDFNYPVGRVEHLDDIYVVMLEPPFAEETKTAELLNQIYGLNKQGEIIWRVQDPREVFTNVSKAYLRKYVYTYMELNSEGVFSGYTLFGMEYIFDHKTGKLLGEIFHK